MECLPHGDHVPCFLHVMHPQYSRASLERKQSHGEAAGEALLDRPPREMAEGRLARQPRDDGLAERGEFSQLSQDLEIVAGVLAEPEPGVDDDSVRADAREPRLSDRVAEERLYFGNDVVVLRLALHGGGLARSEEATSELQSPTYPV